MTTQTSVELRLVESTEAKKEHHYICCDDEDLALCGADMADTPWLKSGEKVTCKACLRLNNAHPWCDDVCRSAMCPVSALRALKG